MTSLALHQASKRAAGVLLLIALAAPSSGFSQRAQESEARPQLGESARSVVEGAELERSGGGSPSEPDLPGDAWQRIVATLEQEIRATELQSGGNSPDLIGPLTDLGALYQEGEDHLLAVAAIQRALEIVRINDGLYSLEQAPLLRQLIQNAEAIGYAERAWELEQQLLTLAGRHPGDLRTARILRETADRRMDTLSRYNAGEFPPEIVLGCYYSPRGAQDRSCGSGSRGVARRRLLAEAQNYYAQSINVLLRNERHGNDEVPALLTELVHSSYVHSNPRFGERSLRFLLEYQVRTSESWPTRIETLIRIADWQLLYSGGANSNKEALATYEQAYALLREHGVAQASIEPIFSPTTPVVLPAFVSNPLASRETQDASGYIDVTFEITKYGKARRVRILDTTSNATRRDERRLVDLMSRARFRPMVTNGQFADSGPLVVRYHLSE